MLNSCMFEPYCLKKFVKLGNISKQSTSSFVYFKRTFLQEQRYLKHFVHIYKDKALTLRDQFQSKPDKGWGQNVPKFTCLSMEWHILRPPGLNVVQTGRFLLDCIMVFSLLGSRNLYLVDCLQQFSCWAQATCNQLFARFVSGLPVSQRLKLLLV